MSESNYEGMIGPELVISILRDEEKPLITLQLQEEVRRVEPQCIASSLVVLNLMRITGTIKGKRTEDRKWVWWVEDK